MLSVARILEEGRYRGAIARSLSLAWAEVSAHTLSRPLELPTSTRVVAVGGATLGGSGKTPLAVACARELARTSARVALVGHAYRAHPGRARLVGPGDSVTEVGDEALVAAAALAPHGVRVVVASTRALAVELAAREADVLVLDGTLQTAPVRASLSLLAVDAVEPWGRARALPPCGDLVAPVAALQAAADVVVRVGDGKVEARIVSRGAHLGRSIVSFATLRALRIGLACALARPHRLLRFLAARGVTPLAIARARDHGRIPARELRADVDLWLATAKCALHVGSASAPVATIDYVLTLGPMLRARLGAL